MRIVLVFLLLSSLLFSASLPLLIRGNKQLSSTDLYDAIGLRLPYAVEVWESKPSIEPSLVSQSITALNSFYRSRGYFESRITANETAQSITLEITENTPIRVSDIKINSILDVDAAITLVSNDIFDHDKFSASKSAIKKKYGDAGYCNATFNSKAWVDLETHQAHLLFEATPNEQCVFGPVTVASTANIDGNLTETMLQFEEGDPYSIEAISQSYESLYAQEAIARVSINDADRQGNIVPITVSIEEVERPVRFNAGFGYSSDQGFGGQIGLKHRNFFGDLKTLSFDAKYTEIKTDASALLSIPLRDHYSIHGEAGYTNEKFEGYDSESIFQKLTLKYQDRPSSLLGAVLFDRATTYNSTNPDAFANNSLFIFSPMVEVNLDTRNKLLEPTKGDWLNIKAQGSIQSPLSDATYFKTLLSGAHIESFGEHVFAGRAQWGVLRTYDGLVPSAYRFYAGGMNSNRAYAYRKLGPKDNNNDPLGFNSLLEGTLEYRFPIYEAFRGVLFSDLTYGSDDYLPDYLKPYWGVGLGLRYVTPIGPIAIDAGVDPYDVTQYQLHFRLGELF